MADYTWGGGERPLLDTWQPMSAPSVSTSVTPTSVRALLDAEDIQYTRRHHTPHTLCDHNAQYMDTRQPVSAPSVSSSAPDGHHVPRRGRLQSWQEDGMCMSDGTASGASSGTVEGGGGGGGGGCAVRRRRRGRHGSSRGTALHMVVLCAMLHQGRAENSFRSWNRRLLIRNEVVEETNPTSSTDTELVFVDEVPGPRYNITDGPMLVLSADSIAPHNPPTTAWTGPNAETWRDSSTYNRTGYHMWDRSVFKIPDDCPAHILWPSVKCGVLNGHNVLNMKKIHEEAELKRYTTGFSFIYKPLHFPIKETSGTTSFAVVGSVPWVDDHYWPYVYSVSSLAGGASLAIAQGKVRLDLFMDAGDTGPRHTFTNTSCTVCRDNVVISLRTTIKYYWENLVKAWITVPNTVDLMIGHDVVISKSFNETENIAHLNKYSIFTKDFEEDDELMPLMLQEWHESSNGYQAWQSSVLLSLGMDRPLEKDPTKYLCRYVEPENRFHGEIAELMLYDTVLLPTDITNIQTSLENKYFNPEYAVPPSQPCSPDLSDQEPFTPSSAAVATSDPLPSTVGSPMNRLKDQSNDPSGLYVSATLAPSATSTSTSISTSISTSTSTTTTATTTTGLYPMADQTATTEGADGAEEDGEEEGADDDRNARLKPGGVFLAPEAVAVICAALGILGMVLIVGYIRLATWMQENKKQQMKQESACMMDALGWGSSIQGSIESEDPLLERCSVDTASHAGSQDLGPRSEPHIIPIDQVDFISQIGHGSGGTVYSALWRGTKIAAKVLSSSGMKQQTLIDSENQWVYRETAALLHCRHPNILNFFGIAVYDGNPEGPLSPKEPPTEGTNHQKAVVLLTEFGHCSLYDLLTWENYRQVDMQARMQIGCGLASAIAYLHSLSPPICHMDLKPGNVILKRPDVACLCDFGSAFIGGKCTMKEKEKYASTWGYIPPEMFEVTQKTDDLLDLRAADIHSLAVILQEIFCTDRMTQTTRVQDQFNSITEAQLKSRLIPETPDTLVALIHQCLSRAPSARPNADTVVAILEILITDDNGDTEEFDNTHDSARSVSVASTTTGGESGDNSNSGEGELTVSPPPGSREIDGVFTLEFRKYLKTLGKYDTNRPKRSISGSKRRGMGSDSFREGDSSSSPQSSNPSTNRAVKEQPRMKTCAHVVGETDRDPPVTPSTSECKVNIDSCDVVMVEADGSAASDVIEQEQEEGEVTSTTNLNPGEETEVGSQSGAA